MRHGLFSLALALVLAPPGVPVALAQGLFEEAVSGGGDKEHEGDKKEKKEPGDAAASAATPALTLGGIGFELNGHARGVLYLGKVPDEASLQTKSGYGELGLKVRARKGEWGDALAELRLRAGHEGGETGVTADLREAYVNLYLGPVDLRVGHQVIVWGRADAVNPTNNLTPRDMRVRSPNEDDARLANLALRGHLNLEPLRWEVVWVPFFAPSHFPAFDMAAVGAGMPIKVAFGQPDYPDTDVRHSTLATRLHLVLPAVEASASYLIGTSTFPGIALASLNAGPPLTAMLAFTAYRHQVVGADFATTIGAFGLRGEVAYRSPFGREGHEHVPLPDLQYVLGLDHELLGEVSVLAQYSGRAVLDFEELDTSAMFVELGNRQVPSQLLAKNRMVAGQLHQVQHSATLRLAWMALQDALKLELAGMVNFTTEEVMLRPGVTYDIADALRVTVGAEIYLGPDDTLFGMIDQLQSAGFMELRASF